MTPRKPPLIVKRNKALSVGPLKASQTVGAALAFLGLRRTIPMLHGSQGCTAFAKVYFVRHFREPIPLQTTAMDQVSSVMGADDNVIEGLRTLCAKSRPDLIGLPTTGLAETQGADIGRLVKTFRQRHPEYASIAVVPVATPDYTGSLESGFALATDAIIETLVPPAAQAGTRPGRRPRQVNVLAGPHLTPGDLEALKELIESFGLTPLVLPDLSDSLDGHLTAEDYSPLTIGGTPVGEVAQAGDARATLVIGAAMNQPADRLAALTGVPDHRFAHLMGLAAVDALVGTLAELAERPVPERLERQRAQLQDAMLDCHFMLGLTRIALAGDPDLLVGFSELLDSVGAETVAAVAPTSAPSLERVICDQVKIGDLEDLERLARERDAALLISNSHAVDSAQRLGIPLLRAGFPQYDLVGGYQRTWIGYRGTRATLFDLANLMLSHEQGAVRPYRSRLKQWPESEREVAA
ncbi:nitrogenase iron-molybdenum cofactor biosynthesis protein NifN [Thioalkalicoccus limnaeus]|uniref:Nitrogenase iron-molybdenum cofactor biosynthesis protein NifN n=1 Tax=Thioalkalicoccus limnaeus TaxID=120681 RepID=A0ABV4BFM3_9GAMM